MRHAPTSRRFVAAALLAACTLAGAACGPAGGQASPAGAVHGATGGTSALRHPRDPRTSSALLRIARTFNNDFQENKDAAVYARWDAASRAVISRAAYIRRHLECPSTPHVKVDTWGVSLGPGGAWLVHYSIGGQQFTDWWYYVRGRFVFDLPRSNPSAVALYEAPPARQATHAVCGR